MAGNCSVFIASKAERSGPWLGAASFDRRRMESRTSTTTRGTSSLWWGGFDVCPKLEDLRPPLPVSILKSSRSDFDLSGRFLTTTDALSGTSPTRSARRCPTEICHRATPSSRDSKLSHPACLQRWPTSIMGNAMRPFKKAKQKLMGGRRKRDGGCESKTDRGGRAADVERSEASQRNSRPHSEVEDVVGSGPS
jgi:hypothetical protein